MPMPDVDGELVNVVLPLMVDAIMDSEFAQLSDMTRADGRDIVKRQCRRLESEGYALIKVVT